MSAENTSPSDAGREALGVHNLEDGRVWMIRQLEKHEAVLDSQGRDNFYEHQRLLGVTQRILDKVIPDSPLEFEPDQSAGQHETRIAIQRALGVLEQQVEIEKYLGPSGPRMEVDQLHPVIWDSAQSLWASGHHLEAVRSAAVHLNAHLQSRSTRIELADVELINQVFSTAEAQPGKPRLRWVGVGTTKTESSMRNALRDYALGVQAGIRNMVMHTTTPLPEQEAVEQLAAMSVLARWIDATEVEFHEDDRVV